MKMTRQQGFTLIELMIVVAIIGILAALAIPAYQDYIARSQASEGVELMSGGKTPMAEFYADKGRWPTAAESVMGNTHGKYTNSIAMSEGSTLTPDNMTLTATYNSVDVSNKIAGNTVLLRTTDGGKIWKCSAGNIDPVYLPGACK